MDIEKAKEIFVQSEYEGRTIESYTYNTSAGVWCIKLKAKKDEKFPYCIIDSTTGEAELQFYGLGADLPKDR